MRKRTKIISTLGPSTIMPKKLTELIAAGTDVFRLNLSHAKIEDAKEIIENNHVVVIWHWLILVG